jgi:hypothetical protein
MNLLAPFFDVTNLEESAEEDCACRKAIGWADQGAADALITAPAHWWADHIEVGGQGDTEIAANRGPRNEWKQP